MFVHEGRVKRGKAVGREVRFNWKALALWVGSLAISLLPVYAAVIEQLRIGKELGPSFWFSCFGTHDALWVFGTVLLFCCFNTFAKEGKIKHRKWAKPLAYLGLIIFVFLELTWVFFKYGDFGNSTSEGLSFLIGLGIFLIAVALIVSTPLQIDFIISEGEE